ncbi:hypothetical protein D3C83_206250 [compost metagenome]
MNRPGLSGLTTLSTMVTTASAVNGSPLVKLRPWRSLKRQVFGSVWLWLQLSASLPTIFGSPLDQSRAVSRS